MTWSPRARPHRATRARPAIAPREAGSRSCVALRPRPIGSSRRTSVGSPLPCRRGIRRPARGLRGRLHADLSCIGTADGSEPDTRGQSNRVSGAVDRRQPNNRPVTDPGRDPAGHGNLCSERPHGQGGLAGGRGVDGRLAGSHGREPAPLRRERQPSADPVAVGHHDPDAGHLSDREGRRTRRRDRCRGTAAPATGRSGRGIPVVDELVPGDDPGGHVTRCHAPHRREPPHRWPDLARPGPLRDAALRCARRGFHLHRLCLRAGGAAGAALRAAGGQRRPVGPVPRGRRVRPLLLRDAHQLGRSARSARPVPVVHRGPDRRRQCAQAARAAAVPPELRRPRRRDPGRRERHPPDALRRPVRCRPGRGAVGLGRGPGRAARRQHGRRPGVAHGDSGVEVFSARDRARLHLTIVAGNVSSATVTAFAHRSPPSGPQATATDGLAGTALGGTALGDPIGEPQPARKSRTATAISRLLPEVVASAIAVARRAGSRYWAEHRDRDPEVEPTAREVGADTGAEKGGLRLVDLGLHDAPAAGQPGLDRPRAGLEGAQGHGIDPPAATLATVAPSTRIVTALLVPLSMWRSHVAEADGCSGEGAAAEGDDRALGLAAEEPQPATVATAIRNAARTRVARIHVGLVAIVCSLNRRP